MRVPIELSLGNPVLSLDYLEQLLGEIRRLNEQCKRDVDEINSLQDQITALTDRVVVLETA